MTILPLSYLPSIEHFAHIAKGDYIIDLGENYVKRSARNRAEIMTAGGVMQLTVNIRSANRPRQPITSIEIDYSKRWQHQHWMAILSAYKCSPFFDYYADELEPIFNAKYEKLVDLNLAMTKCIMKLMGLPPELKCSEGYVECLEGDLDLRVKRCATLSDAQQTPYIQVFSDRIPFAANLSILDLLFCEGPNALGYILSHY